MALFEAFDRWTDADFDAYAEAKWRSNRFNRERGAVRQRLASLLEQAVAQAGAQLGDLELWTSRDHPAFVNAHQVTHQLAVWCRSPSQREALQARDGAVSAQDPHACHAHAGIRVDETSVTWLLAVPAEARFDQPAWRAGMADLLALAGEPGAVLVVDGQACQADTLRALAATDRPVDLRIEWRVDRPTALAGAYGVEDVALRLQQTLPVLRAVLGNTPSADAIAAPPQPQVIEPLAERPHASVIPPPRSRPMRPIAPAGTAHIEARPEPPRPVAPPWQPRRDETQRPQETRRPHPPGPPLAQDGRGGGRPQAASASPASAGEGRARSAGGEGRRAPDSRQGGAPRQGDRGPRPGGSSRPYELGPDPRERETVTTVAPGARVTLNTGLFAGKVGTVQAVAGDTVHVLLGLMAVKVALADVRLAS